MLNLDTHIVVHMFAGKLKRAEADLLRNEPLGISAIVFWEIARLKELGRISIGLEHEGFRRLLAELHVWNIDADVCRVMVQKLDFESDPADELIAATSIVHDVPLVTRDERILASTVVPFPKNVRRRR